jgi:hypothetical protein
VTPADVLGAIARAGRPIDWDHVERWVTYWGLADRLSALRRELGE